jgi:phosphohistidine phosphatase
MASIRTLLIFRHADAVRPPATADPDRDLSSRGEDQARRAGQWLAQAGHRPDLAVVSPSVRTTRSWHLAADALASRTGGAVPPVTVEPAVYHGGTDELVGVVQDVPDAVRTVVVCGHDPGLSELALRLAAEGSDPQSYTRVSRGLPKGAVAVLTAPEPTGSPWSWRDVGHGHLTLTQVWVPTT